MTKLLIPRKDWIFIPLLMLLGLVAPVSGVNQAWVDEQQEQIEAIPESPSIDDLRLLATLAVHKSSEDPLARPVGEAAWSKLSSTPDFADRLLKEILEARTKSRAGGGDSVDYDRKRCWIINDVGKLSDYRSIRVLGEFLSDTEVPGVIGEAAGGPSNARLAARSLEQLLENPPTHEDKSRDSDDDLVSWQLWYEQLKAGNRSFRLKGDPQEYSLNGPATAAITPAGTRAARSNPRIAPTAPGSAPSTNAPAGRWPGVALAAACCVLLFAAFKVLRPRR
ncbi:hypothetical protein [Haloferula sp. BvORR071]|uniref:hypothetical protein n=1 Tax=Haloferula sp. BvORR071 TaxID=1396141 RepID=UPI0005526E95|nr:hypothetical protein [Haloferula sp. BvORR071]